MCVHTHEHRHEQSDSFIPRIKESYVELPHSLFELTGMHDHPSALGGTAAGAIGTLAAIRGYQNLRTGGLIHTIEGAGNVALAAASGLTAYEMFSGGGEGHHHHGHGVGLAGALEIGHGVAEIVVGGLEFKQKDRRMVSLLRIAKGSAVLASQLIPSAGTVAGLAHLGTTIATTIADPNH